MNTFVFYRRWRPVFPAQAAAVVFVCMLTRYLLPITTRRLFDPRDLIGKS